MDQLRCRQQFSIRHKWHADDIITRLNRSIPIQENERGQAYADDTDEIDPGDEELFAFSSSGHTITRKASKRAKSTRGRSKSRSASRSPSVTSSVKILLLLKH